MCALGRGAKPPSSGSGMRSPSSRTPSPTRSVTSRPPSASTSPVASSLGRNKSILNDMGTSSGRMRPPSSNNLGGLNDIGKQVMSGNMPDLGSLGDLGNLGKQVMQPPRQTNTNNTAGQILGDVVSTVARSQQRSNYNSYSRNNTAGRVIGDVIGTVTNNRRRTSNYSGRAVIQSPNSLTGKWTPLIIAVVALVIIFALTLVVTLAKDSGEKNDIVRKPLSLSASKDVGFFTDKLDALVGMSTTPLSNGMKEFQEQTGVRPYIVFAPDFGGYTYDELGNDTARVQDYMDGLYYSLFGSDEGHMLSLFYYDEELDDVALETRRGQKTLAVMDDEALKVYHDTMWRHWANDSLTTAEFVGKTYSEVGKKIMTTHKSPWPVFILSWLVVIVVFSALLALYLLLKSRGEKDKHIQKLMNADLDFKQKRDSILEDDSE